MVTAPPTNSRLEIMGSVYTERSAPPRDRRKSVAILFSAAVLRMPPVCQPISRSPPPRRLDDLPNGGRNPVRRFQFHIVAGRDPFHTAARRQPRQLRLAFLPLPVAAVGREDDQRDGAERPLLRSSQPPGEILVRPLALAVFRVVEFR